MKLNILLLITILIVSFSTTFIALKISNDKFANADDIKEINSLIQEFKNTHLPVESIDLASLYPNQNFIELIQSNNNLTDTNSKKYLNSEIKNCYLVNKNSVTSNDKDELLEAIICKKINELPPNFLSSPPYISKTGHSYAYELYLSGINFNREPDWIKNNLNFFHIFELSLLSKENIVGKFKFLSDLNKEILGDITGHNFPLMNEKYLIDNDKSLSIFNLKFYNVTDFENYLNNNNYFLRISSSNSCFYQIGMVCLEKNTNLLFSKFELSLKALLILSCFLFFVIFIFFIIKLKSQKADEENKKLALRVLTHELRTPITNALLILESLNKNIDALPKELEDDFLKIESEIYRLKRLAEKSSTYLNTHDKKNLNFDYKNINSIKSFIESVIDEYKVNIELVIDEDFSFNTDPYWLRICLKNILDNAIKYGTPIYQIKIINEKNHINIFISDGGNFKFKNLSQAIKNARSTDRSLGIGLSIVKKIIESMNGKLELSLKPTTFKIGIRK